VSGRRQDGPRRRPSRVRSFQEVRDMEDVIFVILTLVVFAALLGLVRGIEKL
jgi:hypothetical protein